MLTTLIVLPGNYRINSAVALVAVATTLAGCDPSPPVLLDGKVTLSYLEQRDEYLVFELGNGTANSVSFLSSRGDAPEPRLDSTAYSFAPTSQDGSRAVHSKIAAPELHGPPATPSELLGGTRIRLLVPRSEFDHAASTRCRLTLLTLNGVRVESNEFVR